MIIVARHIHLLFFEKEPQRMRNKEKHFSRGYISNNAMDFLKANIELSATDFKAREKEIRLKLTKSVKERLNNVSGLKLKQMLLDLANQFPEQGHTFYDSDNMQKLKPNIDNISNYIISHNVDISIYKNDFDDLVNVRNLLRSKSFPTTKVGKRQVVSVLNFVTWLTLNNNQSEMQNG